MIQLNLQYFVFGLILMYIPFHLCEEALGNFPQWMKDHNYMPVKKSYGFWMAGNIFFYFPLLVLNAILFHFLGERFLFCAVAVLIWGILNYMEHLIFTIKDKKVSPGFYTANLLFLVGVSGIINAASNFHITITVVFSALIISLILAVVPAVLQKYIGNRLWKNFI